MRSRFFRSLLLVSVGTSKWSHEGKIYYDYNISQSVTTIRTSWYMYSSKYVTNEHPPKLGKSRNYSSFFIDLWYKTISIFTPWHSKTLYTFSNSLR